MRGTTVFLAGGEVETLTRALMDNGVKWVLYSYYYLLAFKKFDFVEKMQAQYPDVEWFLDSGAFTYSVQVRAGKQLPPPNDYVRLYFEYIQRQGHRWVRIAEPDLDGIHGLNVSVEQTEDWLNEMLYSWPDLPIMPCWHSWRGMASWERYLKNPRLRHMAFGRSSVNNAVRRKLCVTARAVGKTVHGFGFTRLKTALNFVPCDSVDSTSWVLGQKFGTLYVFQGNELIVLNSDKKKDRKRFRKYFVGIGCDPKLIEGDDVAELRKANIIAWRNIAERFHELKKRRNRIIPLLATMDPAERMMARVGVEPGANFPQGEERPEGMIVRAIPPLEHTGPTREGATVRGEDDYAPPVVAQRPLGGFGIRRDEVIGSLHPRVRARSRE